MTLKEILKKSSYTREDIVRILLANEEDIEVLRRKAKDTLFQYCGNEIYLRGLVEISNRCSFDCFYCGLRKSNNLAARYIMTEEEILETAKECSRRGYGSIVLQSGQRSDKSFVEFIERVVKKIKKLTKSDILPDGLGITLSLGEQNRETYEKWRDAGAHRYLLRIETSSKELFEKIHPAVQSFEKRYKCLKILNDTGWQTGTGVMIGIPNQSIPQLADDILFMQREGIGMIGMGPYLLHTETPMYSNKVWWLNKKKEIASLALKMVSAARIVLKDVNIASTTALETIMPRGRNLGLDFGANVYMPLMTPQKDRINYMIYEGKPVEDTDQVCLPDRKIGFNKWGDANFFLRQRESSPRNPLLRGD